MNKFHDTYLYTVELQNIACYVVRIGGNVARGTTATQEDSFVSCLKDDHDTPF